MRFLITAMATLVICSAAMTETAQATVAGPVGATQHAAQSLDLTQRVRRVCTRKLRCARFLQCHWEQTCFLTRDYPQHDEEMRRRGMR